MTLQQLEYIIAVEKHRSFLRAAEASFVSQPALSIQINKLEEESGVKIFDRSKKPLRLTKQGEIFIDKARKVLALAHELKTEINTEKERIEGKFRLGIIPTMAPYILPILIQGFQQKYPETKLVIEELQSDYIIDFIKRGEIDIGILATPLNEKSIVEYPVFNESFFIYLPEGHELLKYKEIDADLLENEDLLTLSEGHCFRNQSLKICSTNIIDLERNISYESSSIETLMNLVDRGLGYSLIPELAVKSGNPRIRKFSSPVPIREVSIISKNTFPNERLIEIIKDKITYSLPDKMLTKQSVKRIAWR